MRVLRTQALTGRATSPETSGSPATQRPVGYLRDSNTATAVVGAWCEMAERRSRIAGCVALSKK